MSLRWLRSIGLLFVAYLVLMFVATVWMGAWHDWDWEALRWMSGMHAPKLLPDVIVLDVEGYDEDAPQHDRQIIADFLQGVAAVESRQHEKPTGILIDFYFESIDSTRAAGATTALTRALDAAKRAGVQVYGTVAKPDMFKTSFSEPNWQRLGRLDWRNIYEFLSGGYGHTIFNLYGEDGLFYQECYAHVPTFDESGSAVGETDVRALPILAADARSVCDPTSMKIVRLGAHSEFAYTGISEKQPFPQQLDLTDKYVIVASVEKDLGPVADRSNAEILAWALSDRLTANQDTYYRPLPLEDMLLGLIASFSLITIVAFAAVFQGLRRLRLGKLRVSLPWIAAAMALLATLALFGGLEAFLLANRQIPPQVSLVALSIPSGSEQSKRKRWGPQSRDSTTRRFQLRQPPLPPRPTARCG